MLYAKVLNGPLSEAIPPAQFYENVDFKCSSTKCYGIGTPPNIKADNTVKALQEKVNTFASKYSFTAVPTTGWVDSATADIVALVVGGELQSHPVQVVINAVNEVNDVHTPSTKRKAVEELSAILLWGFTPESRPAATGTTEIKQDTISTGNILKARLTAGFAARAPKSDSDGTKSDSDGTKSGSDGTMKWALIAGGSVLALFGVAAIFMRKK